jgi:hypothetical protein
MGAPLIACPVFHRNQQPTPDSPAPQGADIDCWLAALCGCCTVGFALAVQSLCFDCLWTVTGVPPVFSCAAALCGGFTQVPAGATVSKCSLPDDWGRYLPGTSCQVTCASGASTTLVCGNTGEWSLTTGITC